MANSKENANTGYLAALGSAVFLSLTSIFISYLNRNYHLPALILAFWREIFTALSLLVWFLLFKRDLLRGAREHLKYLLVYGLVLSLFNATWTLSCILNGAAVATVLAYASAGFTVLLGWLILKEELNIHKIIAVLLSLVGCALIVDALNPEVWRINAVSILTGILSGLFYAFYSLMGRSASQRGMNSWTTLFYIFLLAAVFMLSYNLLLGDLLPGAASDPGEMFWLGDSLSGWLILFMLAFGPTLLGYGLYNVSLKHLPSSVANLIVTIEPAFTAIVAWFVLGERYTNKQILGSVLIMLGVVVIRMSKTEATTN